MRPNVAEGLGERKLVTMLFADLSGYTALAETMDAEDVFALIGPTMQELQRVVESFGGTVPLIQGDGFMAVFGVPRAHEDDAERAVRAALAVRDRARELNRGRQGPLVPDVHAGVNSGEVMVAPSAEPSGFTLIGDTVNTASRIGGLAAGGTVLVSEETRRLTSATIRYGPPSRRRAKGKAKPLTTYEALEASRAGPIPSAGSVFVDRDELLGMLGGELEDAERTHRSRVVIVVGEPGIGKTRVASELGHSLSADRFLVGRCPPFGDRPPLQALGDAIATALGVGGGTRDEIAEAIDACARRLAADGGAPAIAADLRTLLGMEVGEAARSERDAARAARLVIEDRARAGPVALVLDDLQWADRSLLELLREIHRDPWNAPVLVLGSSRESLAGLPSTPLAPIDDASMRVLAERLLGHAASSEAVALPVTRANGNALFLEEMIGMLVELGAVRLEGGRWHLADPAALEHVPATIRLLIAARLDALPVDRRRLLHDAAVCGATTWDALLERLSDDPDVHVGLRDLVERDILRELPYSSVAGAREYEWKHALVRDVAYEAIPRSVRASRHLEVAAWLRSTASTRAEPVGAIAFHYERAWSLLRGDAARDAASHAAEYLTRAAEQMYWRQARAAEPLFRRALRAAESSADDDARRLARASVGLAEVLIEMGAHAEAIERADHARRLAEDAGDRALEARALLALGRSESDVGRMQRARTLLGDAKLRFEEQGDLRGQAWAMHRLSETWGWEGLDRELDDLRESYRLFTRARDRFGRAVVAQDLAYILSVEGGPEFHRWYAQAQRLTEDEGDLRSRALLARTWGHHCYSSGRFAEALEAMLVCRPLAAEAGERYAEADALLIGALAGVTAGDPADALVLANEALVLGRELGSLRIPALARLALARAAIRIGRLDQATRALRTARDAVRSRQVRVMYGDVAETEAIVALDRGAWGRARAHAEALASALGVVPMALWDPLPALVTGRALLGAGRPGDALPPLDDAVRTARTVGADGTLALARACLAQARALTASRPRATAVSSVEPEVVAVLDETAGIVARRQGDLRLAIEHLDRAVERWERGGSSSWLARALAIRAEALLAAGDRARAAASKGRARAVATEIGMPVKERTALEEVTGVG